MDKAYFSKVSTNTTWESLYDTTLKQKSKNIAPEEYGVISTINLTDQEFKLIGQDLSRQYACYLRCYAKSVTNEKGILQCIVIQNKSKDKTLIVYTAGRAFPLYVAIALKEELKE